MDNINDNSELWQVEFGGHVRDASFDEVVQSISRGDLLRIDRVRKGTLRWIEAGKVPALSDFFNARDLGTAGEPVVTTSSGRSNVEVLGPKAAPAAPQMPAENPGRGVSSWTPSDLCAVHTNDPAAFICETCENSFCNACPNSYGGTVKICPFCGAMCKPVAQVQATRTATQTRERAVASGFGVSDFAAAFAYPFKYPVSLVLGALMFAFFSIGQGVAGFGGMFMVSAAIICFMMANTLSFGVLANVVENFAQSKTTLNFMPTFEDFNLWDDVVHPFFLMIGVYVSSFGPLAAVFLVSIFLIAGAAKPDAASIAPGIAPAAGQVQQGQNLKDLIARQDEQEKKRIEISTDAAKLAESEAQRGNAAPVSVPPAAAGGQSAMQGPTAPGADTEQQHFQSLSDQINQAHKAELESAFGKTAETKAAEESAMFTKFLRYGMIFLIAAGLALLWGLFYFPAACCVAGYTRSFGATVNPTVGLDTIKRLGGDYAKLLLMAACLGLISLTVSGVLAAAFSPFALPGVGNLPAKFIGSLFGFYLSVVFACVLGFAIYKASDRLQLFKG